MSALLIGEDLKDVMRHVPAPVTVVTFRTPRGIKGITIGSFTSLSLDPPLISFNVMHASSMHDALLGVSLFAVQILREDQAALSERFSMPDLSSEAQFAGISFQMDAHGMPLLEGVLATLHCRPFNIIEAGDHSLVIGEVLNAAIPGSGKPLLYYQQSYREIGGPVDS